MNSKKIPDSDIHNGHRQRMRAKLAAHGGAIFDTYELLEMLLYAVVPYKDTNPISKRLLSAHGSLDGVFSASVEELMMTEGVGERCADYIKATSGLRDAFNFETRRDVVRFSSYPDVGDFFADYFSGLSGNKVTLLLLDNDLVPIDIIDVCNSDFQSAAVRPKPFIEAAIKCRASVAIIAHNHPFGSTMPSEGDMVNNNLISSALSEVGVKLIEHYIVCGRSYFGIMTGFNKNISERSCIDEFIESKSKYASRVNEKSAPEGRGQLFSSFRSEAVGVLSRLIKPIVGEECEDIERRLFRRYQSLSGILDAEVDDLEELSNYRCAVHIKLLAYITSRRITDEYKFGDRYTDTAIVEYVKGLFIGMSLEHFYVISLAKDGRVISCELAGVGTLNSAVILPRQILEIALKNKASAVMFAHNHPGGNTTPSSDDTGLTVTLERVLEKVGIKLICHFIVSGNGCYAIKSNSL